MPHSRPMPSIGVGCHELRIRDENQNWRIVYFIDTKAIVVLDIFGKKTQTTPENIVDQCKKRLMKYLKDRD
jgi:phage-related protein